MTADLGSPADHAGNSENTPEDVAEVVRGLSAELDGQKRRRQRRWLVGLLLTVSVGLGLVYYRRATAAPPEPRFVTEPIARRDVVERVQATGVVEPVHQVEIGAQVSGRVVEVLVDFNEQVKAGQLLSVIDPELFGAEVVQTRAELSSAEAARSRSLAARDGVKIRLERMKSLVRENAASQAELDQMQADYDVALAEVGSAEAQIARVSATLKSASATLKYTKIFSPIDGVIIDRRVEPGQTVASSFNTPVLFVIARDLTEMRVLAEVDEADVGKVTEGMEAEVKVDAFADETFAGTLKQIRLSPNTVEGVVTYSAVILVNNTKGHLRPGMTATATVVSRRADGALAVPTAALRFHPLPPKDAGKSGEKVAAKVPQVKAPGPGEGRVFLPGEGPAEDPGSRPHVIEIGATDGVFTEVKAGLSEGAKVIVDEKPSEGKGGFRLF